jgi:hypothetical protein
VPKVAVVMSYLAIVVLPSRVAGWGYPWVDLPSPSRRAQTVDA